MSPIQAPTQRSHRELDQSTTTQLPPSPAGSKSNGTSKMQERQARQGRETARIVEQRKRRIRTQTQRTQIGTQYAASNVGLTVGNYTSHDESNTAKTSGNYKLAKNELRNLNGWR
ncbi:hypothetical protein I302_102566 [Kwoniella bestiolae CBS 10118]|uniref:Uncharacterized protein n=1 Tax=Kwoniella bestiolae CBS 10118 TaxID=1296100 RepID=A0A1B9GFB3_9TREE|nr:hypothetical protein I302_01253 [Kwoniella bestiolae CBS 10118]OCF29740.1 hypothetical protein I302_01253 [Kwoniella bestiolae CBS 10118]